MPDRKLSFPFLKPLSDLSNIIHQDPIDLKSNEGGAKNLPSCIELISWHLLWLWLIADTWNFPQRSKGRPIVP